MQLTYKTTLASGKPYNTLPADQYLSRLQQNEAAIYQGSFGVYLARKVLVDDQVLYQPLIDIDGAAGMEGRQKTISAIQFAHATIKVLDTLDSIDHFQFLATGGTGFRALSNLLLNRSAYLAFADWIRFEMPHIHDLKPTTETDIPHQVFAYKGDPAHSRKTLIDGHSAIIEKNLLAQGVFTSDDYLRVTQGKPDPAEIISFVQWLISGLVISDLKALGPLGDRLEEYQRISTDFNVNPFSYIKLRNQTEPIGLTTMQEMLSEKGIMSKVEGRRRNQAISFMGLPCPVCGKPTANAMAFPPSYKLKCFNTNCEANNGMPLHRWSGIKNSGQWSKSPENSFNLAVPDIYVSLDDARDLIARELKNRNNSLFILTPGVGKTCVALQANVDMGKERVVIYGAFNRVLQKEAYDKICELSGNTDGFYLLQPREQICQRSSELNDVTSRGFSPSELLCNGCEHRDANCAYYDQRREFGPGVYFVTLHMLQYLQDQIPTPDLIILDENLKAGLLLEDTCTELALKSVLKIVSGADARLIMQLLNIIQQISTHLVENGAHAMIINGRKLTESDIQETTIVELLAKGMNRSEEEIIASLTCLSNTIDKQSRINLYRQGVDLNAIAWINGLTLPSALSFVHINENGDVKYSTKRITRLGYYGTPIKVLDATGDANAYSALIGRKLKTVRADVEWNSNKIHIKINTSRKTMHYAKEPDLIKLLSEMLSYTKAKNVMVATYLRHEKQVLDILNTIDSTRNFMGYHFNGPRGINSYQGCDAVLVIGLPYPNLNSAAQDACILFPDEKDSDKRMNWAEACMQWDLVQCIHRIRPVHKPSVDVVIAANNWPSILPEPDLVIDKSRSANWKEIAIKQLEPFVEAFGFLNQDIGFLANVYVKSKSGIAKQFQENMSTLFHGINSCFSISKSEFTTSLFSRKEEFNSSGNSCFKDEDELLTNMIRKLILVIKVLYNQNSLSHKNICNQLVSLLEKQNVQWTNDDIILSNAKQWTDLLIHFKETNPHFEKFKIKLPHAHGMPVTGAGNPDRVRDFYNHINDLGIVGRIDIDSYQPTEACLEPVSPIPAGFVSIYIPDEEGIAFIGWGSEFASISLDQEPVELRACFEGIVVEPGAKIITNNGKEVAKAFFSCDLPICEIIDVIIAEKLIANGEVEYRALNLKKALKRHDFPEGLERSVVVHRLVDVWAMQEPLIKSMGLETIFDIESRLIWVTAKIEAAGIGIDADGLLRYYDFLNAKLENLIAALEKTVPAEIPLNDREKIKEHLNSAYALSLAKIDEYSVKTIHDTNIRALCCNLLDYWKIGRECRNVELYISLTGTDSRVYDSIDQLNTKTGRFYRSLQTVQKDGPMRSLFRAKDGYKFIVADYSQQEARIIAGLSNDRVAIEMFKVGKDIYLETAKSIIGACGDSRRYRNLGKEIVLGLNNGRSAYSIYESLARLGFGYDLDDVHGFILRYNMAFQGIQTWRDNVVSASLNDGIVSTKLGRTLKVSKDANINSLYNYPVQGTAADGFKLALIYLDNQLAGHDARIIHILHDEVIVEAKDDVADAVTVIVKECMEMAFSEILPVVPFVVVPEIREGWG
jgi:DNA polymerase I-like protein with 3'-5' exonuclease and polymerase domains